MTTKQIPFLSFPKKLVFCLTILCGRASFADQEDKSSYHLFHPVPDAQLRDLSTDRPDKTESPYSVDAGHYQIEMDIATYSRSHNGGKKERAWSLAPFNIKAGLTSSTDLQFVFAPYQRVDASDPSSRSRMEGVGDLDIRLKYNLLGNDTEGFALALMPYVKAPTNSNRLGNDQFEGGLIVPYGLDIGENLGLGMMTQVDVVRNEENSGNDLAFIQTATLGTEFTEHFGGYAELFAEIPQNETGDWIGTIDFGLTYGIGKNIQLDAGVNVGATHSAEDLQPFIGYSQRY